MENLIKPIKKFSAKNKTSKSFQLQSVDNSIPHTNVSISPAELSPVIDEEIDEMINFD